MAQITWRNVDAPSFAGVNDALRLAQSNLQGGLAAGRDALGDFDKFRTKEADAAAVAKAMGYQDQSQFRDALSSGKFFEGIDPTRLSSDALKTIDGRAQGLANLAGTNIINEGRTIANQQNRLDLSQDLWRFDNVEKYDLNQKREREATVNKAYAEAIATGSIKGAQEYIQSKAGTPGFDQAVVNTLSAAIKPELFAKGDAAGAALEAASRPGAGVQGGSAADIIKRFEGFIEAPKWDVNAHRAGYGTDTITRADGTVEKVTESTRFTREDADRDLARRIPEFQATATRQAPNFVNLPENVKAALTSVTYNYGSLPESVVAAVQSGDVNQIASAVEGLQGHNDGINRNRRLQEAAIIRGNVSTVANPLNGGGGSVAAPRRSVAEIDTSSENAASEMLQAAAEMRAQAQQIQDRVTADKTYDKEANILQEIAQPTDPKESSSAKVAAALKKSIGDDDQASILGSSGLNDTELQKAINHGVDKYGVSPALVGAIIQNSVGVNDNWFAKDTKTVDYGKLDSLLKQYVGQNGEIKADVRQRAMSMLNVNREKEAVSKTIADLNTRVDKARQELADIEANVKLRGTGDTKKAKNALQAELKLYESQLKSLTANPRLGAYGNAVIAGR